MNNLSKKIVFIDLWQSTYIIVCCALPSTKNTDWIVQNLYKLFVILLGKSGQDCREVVGQGRRRVWNFTWSLGVNKTKKTNNYEAEESEWANKAAI